MIARISSEGQFRLESACLDKLNEIDNQLVDVVAKGDEMGYKRLLDQMLNIVRTEGQPVPNDEVLPSDVILPAPDTTFQEAMELFSGEGVFAG